MHQICYLGKESQFDSQSDIVFALQVNLHRIGFLPQKQDSAHCHLPASHNHIGQNHFSRQHADHQLKQELPLVPHTECGLLQR